MKKYTVQSAKCIVIIIAAAAFFAAGSVYAQIPEPYRAIGQEEYPEFHSLRPYQASPPNQRKDEDIRLYCGNDLIARETYEVTPGDASECVRNDDGSQTCNFYFSGEQVHVELDLTDMELPIAGNTQIVPNSVNPEVNNLTPAQRMNEYVSWYLNGVIYRAEEDPLAWAEYEDPEVTRSLDLLINYSGPMRKLFPWRIQTRMREDQKARVGHIDNWGRHNQIVGCEISGVPVPCYQNMGPLRVSRYIRMNDIAGPPIREDYESDYLYWQAYLDWQGRACYTTSLNLFNGYPVQRCSYGYGSIPYSDLYNYIPFSSTADRKGEIFVNLTQTVQPVIEGVEIHNASFRPDVADNTPQAYLRGSEPDQNSDYHNLYFAHMIELRDLAALLQETYLWREGPGSSGLGNFGVFQPNEVYNTYRCDLGNARWNPGDDLFGEYDEQQSTMEGGSGNPLDDDEQISGIVTYDVAFSCTFPPPGEPDPICVAERYDDCINNRCEPGNPPFPYVDCPSYCSDVANVECSSGVPTCRVNAYPALSVYTRTPDIDYIWTRLVAGHQSIFKRFYPRDLFDTEFHEILDLPAVTTASYSHMSNNISGNVVESQTFAGEPTGGRAGVRADVYLPHLGGIYEYFLKGIQRALRPQDFSTESYGGPPSPGGPPSGTEQCTTLPSSQEIDYRNTNQGIMSAEQIASGIENGIPVEDGAYLCRGNQVRTYYDDVVSRAIAAGYNPGFVVAIWIAESCASDYLTFGNNILDLGCGTSVGLDNQLDCFMGLYDYWSSDDANFTCREGGSSGPTYEDFLLFFAEGVCSTITAQERQFCLHENYHEKIWDIYNFVIGR